MASKSETRLEDSRLFVDGMEIGFVYYRAGYTPKDYPTQKEWEVRHLIESSLAVKDACIDYQLAGAK